MEHVRFEGRNGNNPTLLEQVTVEMIELLWWPCKRTPAPHCKEKPRFFSQHTGGVEFEIITFQRNILMKEGP